MGNKERVSYIAIMIDADDDLESERRKRKVIIIGEALNLQLREVC